MKFSVIPLVVAIAVISPACSIQSPSSASVSNDTVSRELPAPPPDSRETLLLVSLEDGSIIKQTIWSDADICFKKNSESATMCLTQGAPIFSQENDTVIGFEMVEDQIDLIAKSE